MTSQVMGYFDENIWPAYYEDNDADNRLVRAVAAGVCSPRKVITPFWPSPWTLTLTLTLILTLALP